MMREFHDQKTHIYDHWFPFREPDPYSSDLAMIKSTSQTTYFEKNVKLFDVGGGGGNLI